METRYGLHPRSLSNVPDNFLKSGKFFFGGYQAGCLVSLQCCLPEQDAHRPGQGRRWP